MNLADEQRLLETVIRFTLENGALTKKQLEQLDTIIKRVDDDSGNLAGAIEAVDRSMAKNSGLKELKAELRGLSKIYRDEVRRIAESGGDTSGAIGALSPEQQKRAIQLQQAITAATVTESRKRQSEVDKAVSQSIASTKRETDARVREYTRAYQEGIKIERRLAQERERLRNRPVQRASRNDAASPLAFRQAQDEYSRQELSQMGEYYRNLERTSAATQQTTKATQQLTSNLPRLRYALYDVSTSMAVTGAALLGFSTVAFSTAIKYERAFADVIRTTETTGTSVEHLRDQFRDLASTLPLAFTELAKIGTLAGQLNIPTADVAEFTKLVAQFAATTDVSIEQSATAFGRLSELLGLNRDQFDNLGSAILGVGINSVATESSIVAITTQLAGVANQAGLTADELIGLSSALASVGIQPELARGTITRLFGQIGRAVGAGGEALENFGRISGQSGAEFAESWASTPIDALLDFFDGIAEQGGNAETALRELGITSIRDVPAILRLAQTADTILKPALQVAAEEFANGTALADQYGIIAETTAEKLTVLANNFGLLLEQIGQAGLAFGGLIDLTNALLRELTAIAENPIASSILQIATVVGALGGAFLILGGLTARGLASLLAVRTAMAEMGITSLSAAGGVTGLTRSLVTFSPIARTAGASATYATAQMGILGVSAQRSALGLGAASISMRGLGTAALRVAGPIGIVASLLLPELIAGLSDYSDAVEIAADNTIDFESALGNIGKNVDWTDVLLDPSSAAQGGMIVGGVVGAAIASTIEDTLAGSSDSIMEGLNRLGSQPFDMSQVTGLTALVGGAINDAYAQDFAALDQALVSVFSVDKLAGIQQFNELLAQVRANGGDVAAVYANLPGIFDAISSVNYGEVIAEQSRLAALDTEALAGEMRNLVDDVFGGVRATEEMNNALSELGTALFDSGAEAAFSSQQFQDVISGIVSQSAGAQDAANQLQGLFDSLIAGGYATADQLTYLTQVIGGLISIAGGSGAVATNFDISALGKGFDSAAQGAAKLARAAGGGSGGAARAVRTLVDYANDLQKVFGRSFDIRFGSQLAVDEVAGSWADLADRIREASIELQGLEADRDIKEYFLSVAEAYGDELRAGKLRAEIAEINEEIADTQADASTELEGNSKAARENRKRLTDLLGGYEDYIVALAEGGADQATLNAAVNKSKAEFIEQARALGFADAQLQPYIRSFGDMITIIGRIPRNITVNANANPAIQALNEYNAALDRARSNASRGVPAVTPYVAKARYQQISISSADRSLYARLLNSGVIQGYISGNSWFKYLGTYASGGYTGRGGKYEPAGIVHKGEYVVPKSQVNQSTGMPYADALGRQQVGSRPSSGGYANGGFVNGSMGVMELGPKSLGVLRQAVAKEVAVYLGDVEVAQASNRGNKQIVAMGGRPQ